MTGEDVAARVHAYAWADRKPGLERTRALLAALGNPEKALKFVHITGSNGKGSTAAMLASVLAAAGYRTGLFTSPHLYRFNERFQVNGAPIPDAALDRLAERVLAAADTLPEHPTEFELMTAIGFLWFAEAGCDLVVVEVGLGGRLDSTNVIPAPEAAVITNIGDAHIENLGNTRQGTLRAKSEIFEHLQPGGLAVLNGDDALLAGLELPFETILCGRGENCAVRVTDIVTHGVEGLSCTVTTPCGVYPLHIPSPGDYMIYPASMAVAIGERLGLTAQQIREGVAHYVSTGSRMRRIRLPEERLIIDDCYNANPQAMAAALTILADTDCRRRVAVMGDMGELGRLSSDAHREAGALAARLGLDQVIAIGEKARLMAQGAGNIALHFATVEQAMPAIQETLTPGTAMLVKASHAMEFHRIVEALTQEA